MSNEYIEENWNDIFLSIEEALPPYAEESEEDIRELLIKRELFAGNAECWVLANKAGDPYILFTLQVAKDLFSEKKFLIVYSVYAYKTIRNNVWLQTFNTLRKRAKKRGFYQVVAYTNNKRILSIAKALKWDISFHFIRKEL